MILFVMDACAIARRYFTDIGTRNIDQLFDYPDSMLVLPNIARSEAVSAMIAAYNAMLIDETMRDSAIVQFADNVQNGVFLEVKVNDTHISESIRLLEKHKIVPHGTQGAGKAGIGGADSIILSIAVELAQSARQNSDRTIFVTSDWALYSAANDEPDLEVFHFWTCECPNCGYIRIPQKGRREVCPDCEEVCSICQLSVCDSRYIVRFRSSGTNSTRSL